MNIYIKHIATKKILNKSHLSKRNYTSLVSQSYTDNETPYEVNEAMYHLPSNKEWINSTYAYNKNTLKPLVAADSIANELIRNYFNLEISNDDKKPTRIKTRFKRLSLNKIFVSKAEVKHLNDKNIITVYTYNRNSKHTHYKIRKSSLPSFSTSIKNRNTTNITTITGDSAFKHNGMKKGTGAFSSNRNRATGKKKSTLVKIKLSNTNKANIAKWPIFMLMGLNKRRKRKLLKRFKLNSFSHSKLYPNAKVKNITNKVTLLSRHNKLNYNTQKALKKYLLIRRFFLWKNLEKASLINWKTTEFGNIIKENQYLIFLYWLKIISLETVIKIVSIIRRIIRSYKLNRNQKIYLIRIVRQNLIKRYHESGTFSKPTFITLKDHNNNFLLPESHIVKRYNTINAISLYKKKMIYLYNLQKLSLNNAKFKNWFIIGLRSVLSKVFNKKIDLNIVNLKYLYFNSDNFVVSIATKLRNRKNRLLRVLKKATKMVSIPSSRIYSYQHNTPSISTVYNAKPSIKDFVLSAIKYKRVNGVRIEAAGRLSKRLTASRSVFKLKYKGSTRDVKISRDKTSSSVLVGYKKPNVQYTNLKSKTLIGSFGLKASISSTNSIYTPVSRSY